MKTNNIFDKMTNENEINEQTVTVETGVSTERVKELFGEMVMYNGKTKSAKKRGIKKVFTVVAAAVAATLVLGTVTAGATGSFNGVFGQMFSGEAADGMFSGGNVQISSDIVDVDFKGIAGDNEEMIGKMVLTKKDGSQFFEGDKDEYFIWAPEDEENIEAQVTCTKSLADQISSKLFYHAASGQGNMMYDFIDNSSIEAIFSYNDTEFNIIGETLSIQDDHINLYHIDKVLMTWDEQRKFIDKHSDENDPFWDGDDTFVEKIGKLNNVKLGENQLVNLDSNGSISVLTKTRIDIGLDVSVKLNYKDTTRSFNEAAGIKTTYSGCDVTVKSLEVRPFSVRLVVEYPTTDLNELTKLWESQDPEAKNLITVTLKNGQSYSSDQTPGFGSDNTERMTFHFDYGKVVMDPSQVTKIVYNGTTLYEA